MPLCGPILNKKIWLESHWPPVTPMDGVILISKGSNPSSLPRAVGNQRSQEVIGAQIRNWGQVSVSGLIARPPGLCPVDLLGEVSVAESSGCTVQDPSFRADNGCNQTPLIFSISTLNWIITLRHDFGLDDFILNTCGCWFWCFTITPSHWYIFYKPVSKIFHKHLNYFLIFHTRLFMQKIKMSRLEEILTEKL